MTTEQDYQYEINGLLVGHDTPFMVLKVEGLFSMPDIVTSDTQREGRDGEYSGNNETLTGRTITMELAMLGDETSDNDADTLYELLQAVTSSLQDEWPLRIKRPNRPERAVYVKTRRRHFTSDYDFAKGHGKASLQFKALDPRIYEAEGNMGGPIQVFAPIADFVFPITFNRSFGTASVGVIFAENLGSYETPAILTLQGPVDNPSIDHIDSGKSLSFNLSLGVGETLVVDLDNKTVLLNGVTNRRSLMTVAQWFMLSPGINRLRFRGTTVGAPSLTASWRSAWI